MILDTVKISVSLFSCNLQTLLRFRILSFSVHMVFVYTLLQHGYTILVTLSRYLFKVYDPLVSVQGQNKIYDPLVSVQGQNKIYDPLVSVQGQFNSKFTTLSSQYKVILRYATLSS